MLVITRRVGEALIIGDNTRVIPLGVHGNQVRLGIDAPRNVAVHRQEVYERIREETQNAKSGACHRISDSP